MTSEIEFIKTDFDKAEYLQRMLLARGTGGDANDDHYIQMRHELMSTPSYVELLPRWLKTNRNLEQ